MAPSGIDFHSGQFIEVATLESTSHFENKDAHVSVGCNKVLGWLQRLVRWMHAFSQLIPAPEPTGQAKKVKNDEPASGNGNQQQHANDFDDRPH
jgi:hypothetical protein